jgi:Pvc16 N-terminal domain
MIIPTIDTGLEALVRQALPLPTALGDVSFDSPSGTWSSQLNRITVNMFLFGVGRSPQPPRPAAERVVDGRTQRRAQLPMLQLHYLVSAWAGSVRDEHQLIGDVLTVFLLTQVLPDEHLPAEMTSGVQLAVAPHDNNRAKDVWSTVGGTIKPSFELMVTTASDALPFVDLPTSVERIEKLVAPRSTFPGAGPESTGQPPFGRS